MKQDTYYTFPSTVTVGYGQEYAVTHGDNDMDGKDWGWLVYGLRYWNEVTPVYVSHISVQMLYAIIPANSHLSFKDMYNRITKYEHIGIFVEHIPITLIMRNSFNGIPGITSYGTEFIINNLEDFSYSTSGQRELKLKFKVYYHIIETANWEITFSHDSITSKYVADIQVDISPTVLTGSVSVDSAGVSYLTFFVAFGPAPY